MLSLHRPFALLGLWSMVTAVPAGTVYSTIDIDALWDSDEPTVFLEGDQLHYYGPMTEIGAERVQLILQDAPPTLSALRIASPGGDGLAAQAIAESVHQRTLEVIVVGKGCSSACANYIFTPAKHRTISSGSLVTWHRPCPSNIRNDRDAWRNRIEKAYENGGLKIEYSKEGDSSRDPGGLRKQFEDNLEEVVDVMTHYIDRMRSGHSRIFQGTRIDDRITCLVSYIDLPSPDYLYTFSIEDMARFGICNVQAPLDYVQQAEAKFKDAASSSEGGVVRLADHPDLKPLSASNICASPTR